MKIAVTGGTGFVGARFIETALGAGHELSALTRRPQPERSGIEWVEGSLEDSGSLRRLAAGCAAVVHVAGVINARSPAEFERSNVDGTEAMLEASKSAGVTRFVHISSLAAREPALSVYGRSKARSEELVERSGLDWVIVRPPAVYGPGDKETLDLFKMARLRLMLLPPEGRVSLIHVNDLARLLLALASGDRPKEILLEPDDGAEHGWSHKDLARAIGEAVGRPNLALSVPAPMLKLGAALDQIIRRERAKLSTDRAAYFSHRDWVVSPEKRPPANLWQPEIGTPEGLRSTAAWYRAEGWL